MEKTYSVLLFRLGHNSETIETNLSLEEAREICKDPETSSRTSSDPFRYGEKPWFFGYVED